MRTAFRNVVMSGLKLDTPDGTEGLDCAVSRRRRGRELCTPAGMLNRGHQLCLTAICVAGVCSTFINLGTEAAARAITSGVPATVVELTNAERSRAGRGRLRANPRLMQAAQVHAEQIARAGQPAHVLPDAAYPRIEDRLAAVGYRWQSCGENLALGQSSPGAAVRSWMRSRGHRRNLVNPTFTELGVGYATDQSGRPYYVQVFASPSS